MADKDVQLVIRARDEASKAISSITGLVQSLTGAQDKLGQSAVKADSLLGQLSAELGTLKKAAEGMTVMGQVAAQVERSDAAVQRMTETLGKARSANDAYTKGLVDARMAADALNKRVEASQAAFGAQRAAAQNSARALADVERQVSAVQNALSQRRGDTVSTPEQAERYQLLLDRLRSLQQLRARLAEEAPAEAQALAAFSTVLDQDRAAAEGANATLVNLQKGAASTAATAVRLARDVDMATVALADMRTTAAQGATALGLVGQTQADIAAGAQQTANRIATLAGQIDRLKTPAAPASPAVGAPTYQGAGDVGQLAATYRAQKTAVAEAAGAMEAAQKAATGLYVAMREVDTPTAEMARDFELARAAVRSTTQAFEEQSRFLGTVREQIQAVNQAARDRAEAPERQSLLGVMATMDARQAELDEQLKPKIVEATKPGALAQWVTGLQQGNEAAEHGVSIYRRLRDEVTGLVTGYAGLFAVYGQIHELITASTEYEAAQIRITTALGKGDAAGTAAFEHAKEQAIGLKVAILPAADAYGQLIAATKGTAIEGRATQQMFDDLLVSIRAFKLGPENMNRVVIALRDMASRGNATKREINQLSQALPIGLLQEMQRALGLNAEEFAKFDSEGAIGLGTVVQALHTAAEAAGKNLPEALKSAQATFADFGNQVFQFRVAVGQSGFLDSIVAAVGRLNEMLKSPEGRDAAGKLGAVLGHIVDLFTVLIEHGNAVMAVIAGIAGVKMVGAVASFTTLGKLLGSVVGYGPGIRVLAVELLGLEASAAGAAFSAAGLATALAPLLGPLVVGAAVFGVAVALEQWATRTSAASQAMALHKDVVDRVTAAYAAADNAAQGWTKHIAEGSLIAIEGDIRAQSAAVAELTGKLTDLQSRYSGITALTRSANPQTRANALANPAVREQRQILDLIDAYKAGSVSAADFGSRLDDLDRQFQTDAAKKFAASVMDIAKPLKDHTEALAASSSAAQQLGSKTKDLTENIAKAPNAFHDMTSAVQQQAGAVGNATDAWALFGKALEAVQKQIPTAAAALKLADAAKDRAGLLARANTLEDAGSSDPRAEANAARAERLAMSTNEAARAAEMTEALKGVAGDMKNLVARVLHIENASGDPNARSSAGAEGPGQFMPATWREEFKKTFPDSVNMPDAQIDAFKRDLGTVVKVMETYLNEIGGKISAAGFSADNANRYLGYNLGPAGAISFLRQAQSTPDAPARDVGSMAAGSVAGNPAIYAGRTFEQVLQFLERRFPSDQKFDADGLTKGETARNKVDRQYTDQTADLQARTRGADQSEREKYVEQQLEEERRRVRDNPDAGVTAAEEEKRLAVIRQQAEAEYDVTHAREAEKKAVQDLVALDEQRKTAVKDYQEALSNGDLGAADRAKQTFADLTTKINAATAATLKLAEAQKDEAGVAAIKKVSLSMEKLHTDSQITGRQINELFAGDVTNAFDSFFSSVAQGEGIMKSLKNAVLEMAASFLKSIAEMIIKQQVLNLLQGSGFGGAVAGVANGTSAASGGGLFSGLASLFPAILHDGGVVGGTANVRRSAPAEWFANARRYHDGGYPGLAPNEVPAILQKGELVMTAAQQRAEAAAKGGSQGAQNIRNVLVMDPKGLADALSSSAGEKVVISHIKNNVDTVRGLLRG